jgi:hypothetical protein
MMLLAIVKTSQSAVVLLPSVTRGSASGRLQLRVARGLLRPAWRTTEAQAAVAEALRLMPYEAGGSDRIPLGAESDLVGMQIV